MESRKKIFSIVGSASSDSASQKIVEYLALCTKDYFSTIVFNKLKDLPHFDPEQSIASPPHAIIEFRSAINEADGIIICTPEYVFSIPSGLKNAIEWCVATVVFSNKPMGLITASAQGRKGHEELQTIMKTVMGKFSGETTLLIDGAKGKISADGAITDLKTKDDLAKFIQAFKTLLLNTNSSEPGESLNGH